MIINVYTSQLGNYLTLYILISPCIFSVLISLIIFNNDNDNNNNNNYWNIFSNSDDDDDDDNNYGYVISLIWNLSESSIKDE